MERSLVVGCVPSIPTLVAQLCSVDVSACVCYAFFDLGTASDGLLCFTPGCVYVSYVVYLGELISQNNERKREESANESCWPGCWNDSLAGQFGLALMGIFFLIACVTQFIPAFWGTFRRDLLPKDQMNKLERWIVYGTGHVGFFFRGVAFLLMAVLLFRAVDHDVEDDSDPLAEALNQLQESGGGKFFLGLIGLGLLIYGVFATLNTHYKVFPTVTRTDDHETVGAAQMDQPDYFMGNYMQDKLKLPTGSAAPSSHRGVTGDYSRAYAVHGSQASTNHGLFSTINPASNSVRFVPSAPSANMGGSSSFV